MVHDAPHPRRRAGKLLCEALRQSAARSKLTKPSSAARPATCTAERQRRITGTGGKDKTIVMGMLQRGGKVRPWSFQTASDLLCKQIVRDHVEPGCRYTPMSRLLSGTRLTYVHEIINHAKPTFAAM